MLRRAVFIPAVIFIMALAALILSRPSSAAGETFNTTNLIERVFNDSNGLPTGEANVVLQTSDGYIWIGSYGGLIRYDSSGFDNMSEEGVVGSSAIRALCEDSKGRLWIGSNDKGVYRYDGNEAVRAITDSSQEYQSVRAIAEDSKGRVYIGTANGVACVRSDMTLIKIPLEGLGVQIIESLAATPDGLIWGATGSGYVFSLHNGLVETVFKPGELCSSESYRVFASSEGELYIASAGNEIAVLSGNFKDGYSIRQLEADAYSSINAFCEARSGRIYVGTQDGIGFFEGDSFNILDNLENAMFIDCICEDYEGNLWAASTKYGVIELIEGKYYNANSVSGLNDTSINAILPLDDRYYIATDTGLVILDENYNRISNELTEMTDGVRIRNLMLDSSKRIWISTYINSGVIRYDPATGKTVQFTTENGLLSEKNRQTLELSNGDFAVAGNGGLNIIRGDRVIDKLDASDGLENTVILCMLERSDGTIMLGTDGDGIYTVKDGKITGKLFEDAGLTTGVVLRMVADNDAGVIWICAGSALYCQRQDGVIEEIDGLGFGTGSVFDVIPESDSLWILKSGGAYRVAKDKLLDNSVTDDDITVYGKLFGLTGTVTSNAWNWFDGEILYLCTGDGMSMLNIASMPKNTVEPRVIVNYVSAENSDGQTTKYNHPSELTLPQDTRRITIDFAVLTFGAMPSTVSWSLNGFDDGYYTGSGDTESQAVYTNLPGGKFSFRLGAVNPDGAKTSNEYALTINKELQWYERASVYVVIAVAAIIFVVLVMWLLIKYKTHKIKRRQQEYKAITDQALNTIANTIDAKDTYTNGHSVRVAAYCREIVRRMGWSESEQERMYYIAMLHDIGKIGVPDAVLNKPGKLTPEEYAIIQTHPRIGGDILKDFTAIRGISDGARYHHERIDGKGYNSGLKGTEIPLEARIIGVADAYDAMTTARVYRPRLSDEAVLEELRKGSGTQFDADIVAIAVSMIEDGFKP